MKVKVTWSCKEHGLAGMEMDLSMVSREISDEDDVPHLCSPFFPFEREVSMVHSSSVQHHGTLVGGSVQGSSCWLLFQTLEGIPRQG